MVTCILLHRNIKKDLPKIVLGQFPLGCQLPVPLSHSQHQDSSFLLYDLYLAVLGDIFFKSSSPFCFLLPVCCTITRYSNKIFVPSFKSKIKKE